MDLDERLRRLADRVPAPPPGDPRELLGRGLRRRRTHRIVSATAAVALVGALGLGVASLTGRPVGLDVADQPPTSPEGQRGEQPAGGAVIAAAPTVTLHAAQPFPWVVAVSAGDGDQWCVTAVEGTDVLGDVVGRPCTQRFEHDGGVLDLSPGGSSSRPGAAGPPSRAVSWGSAPAAADTVVVVFTDGTRRPASTATDDALGATLWAIGYEGVRVQAVEALDDDTVIAGFEVLDRP